MTASPTPIVKPAIVIRAIWLMCVSLGIVLACSLWESVHNFVAAQTGFFELLIMAWLTHKTNQGRNWARITFLVLYIFGVLISIPALFMVPQPAVRIGVFIIQAILQIVSSVMLFSRDARPWFRPATTPNTALEPTPTEP